MSDPTRRCIIAGAAMIVAGTPALALGFPPPLRRYVTLMTRAEGMSHDAFIAALLAQGAREKKSSGGLSGLVISEVLPRFNGRPAQLDTDAVVEIWARDGKGYRSWFSMAQGRNSAGAASALASRLTTYVTREHRFIPPNIRDKTLRGMGLVVRKNGLSPAEFKEKWLGIHGPMARMVPGLKGFVLSEISETLVGKGEPVMSECDGIAESWWETPAGGPAGSSVPSDQAKAFQTSGDRFLQRDKARNLSLRSYEFIPVPA
jgi:hypothetical protein